MNREYASTLITSLLEWGVAEFYVCAGARNIPLVEVLVNLKSSQKIVFNHFEERSAAFYALGRIKSLQKPVAVVTTSGTAVGELLPAVMEAYYSGLPLVCITADRPRSYRGSGAPQVAEQNGIFGPYVSRCFDLEINEPFELRDISQTIPLHINACFDVPLQSGVLASLIAEDLQKSSETKMLQAIAPDLVFSSDSCINALDLKNINTQIDQLMHFLEQSKSLIVICAQLKEQTILALIHFLKKLNCPVYLESTSHIRESNFLSNIKIYSPDTLWINAKESKFEIDSVLKIGGTPTHRIWRDLDETYKDISVLSINENFFSGLSRAKNIHASLECFFELSTKRNFKKIQNKNVNLFLNKDKLHYKNIYKNICSVKKSEENFVNTISKIIPKNSRVYIGNSMPIRNWDLYATHEEKNLIIEASRGLNGIDGQISTFLGFASESAPSNWGIFGDLTALYDFSGLWILKQRPQLKVNIIVINNSGGKIFNRVLSGKEGEFCQNTHTLNFKYFAQMWGISYKKITSATQLKNLKYDTCQLVEIITN